jgi:transposase
MHQLEKKLKDVDLERDMLKKAIGIFSKSGR